MFDQRIRNRRKVARDNLIQLVDCEVNSVIRHPVFREIVRTNSLAAMVEAVLVKPLEVPLRAATFHLPIQQQEVLGPGHRPNLRRFLARVLVSGRHETQMNILGMQLVCQDAQAGL